MRQLYVLFFIALNLAFGAISKQRFDPSWLLPFEPSTSTKSPSYDKSEFDSLKSEVVSRFFFSFSWYVSVKILKYFDKHNLKVENGEITGKLDTLDAKVGKMESDMDILKAEMVFLLFWISIFPKVVIFIEWAETWSKKLEGNFW